MVKRHSRITRAAHWLNVVCIVTLLMSGLQIFNAHPELYWGNYGDTGDRTALKIESENVEDTLRGYTSIGGKKFETTGILGASISQGAPVSRAFPAWITFPSSQDLAKARRWHFFVAWLFVVNGGIYLANSLVNGHFTKNLLPQRDQISLRHIGHEISNHIRLRFPKGEEAKRYNSLQKITYLVVIMILLPNMLLTGLSMSPGFHAILPALPEIYRGRQSARTIHIITAFLIFDFIILHLVMVILSGTWNNIRSMITGWYAIQENEVTND